MNYKEKYLKYKNKYLELKNQFAGTKFPAGQIVRNILEPPTYYISMDLIKDSPNTYNLVNIDNGSKDQLYEKELREIDELFPNFTSKYAAFKKLPDNEYRRNAIVAYEKISAKKTKEKTEHAQKERDEHAAEIALRKKVIPPPNIHQFPPEMSDAFGIRTKNKYDISARIRLKTPLMPQNISFITILRITYMHNEIFYDGFDDSHAYLIRNLSEKLLV
jgi:hypothetical protein